MAKDKVKNKRKNAISSITRIRSFLDASCSKTIDVHEYLVREEALELAYARFCEAQDEIEIDNPNPVEDEKLRDEVETNYLSMKAEIKRFISKCSQNLPSCSNVIVNNSTNQSSSKMPEIVIDKFSGEQKNWTSFFDIFSALVLNNPDLDDVQKFIYLKSSLKGEPLHLIENLSLTSANLNTALDTLKKRYENKLATIYSHVKALVEMPSIVKNNQNHLREFIVAIKQNSESLKNLNVPVKEWDLILVYLLTQKLDFNTRRAYELDRGPTQLPTLDNFLEFLEKRCLATENLSSPEARRKVSYLTTSNNNNNRNMKGQNNCLYCKLPNHNIQKCLKFKSLNVSQRKQFIFNKHLCFKCFSSHSASQCSWKNCPICDLPHNSLLHSANHNQVKSGQSSEVGSFRGTDSQSDGNSNTEMSPGNANYNRGGRNTSDLSRVEATCTAAIASSQQHVLIATATILVAAKNGKTLTARAILDSGSQLSLVTSNLVKKLNLQSQPNSTLISGVSGKKSVCNQMVDLSISSLIDQNRQFNVRCSVLEKITCPLPQVEINRENLKIPKTMLLADPQFFTPGKIDLLLGSDVYYEVLEPGLLRLGDGLPILQNSCFGWVLGGPIAKEYISLFNTVESQSNRVSLFTSTVEINNQMEKFWSLEEVSTHNNLSDDDALAEQLFVDTTKVLGNGRFMVNIPLKNPKEYLKLGESFKQAEKRFYSIEKRLHRDRKLFEEYKEFIEEYVRLNHGRYVPLQLKNINGDNKYFIPHHCVIREDKTTTRLRVVFDASSKSTSGYSLNDITLKGYQVQPDLFDILLRFRSFEYTLVVDIKKMFRQIVINPSQTFLQNILWREDPQEELKCIELLVLSYGVNFAPFISTRCLLELANNYESQYPLGAVAIREQCYMDDVLGGADTPLELFELGKQLIALLGIARFELHKWKSNSKDFLQQFGDKTDNPSLGRSYDILSEDHSSKVLGISWCSATDQFMISLPKDIKVNPVTKRNVLSKISQIYDPLGFVAPITVLGKMLMQQIWLAKLTWDQVLSEKLTLEWTSFVKNLTDLSNQKIPRCFLLKQDLQTVQLHGFADASLKAYGACVYIRGLYKDKSIHCNLVCSKSRISPVRTVSLPRLELCACLLLANLIKKVLNILKVYTFDSVNLWTDSQISLCWINSHPSRWNVFVSNRVALIQELTSKCKWGHVRSSCNPADHLTRGLTSSDLLSCRQWWVGPEFLYQLETMNSFQSEDDVFGTTENIPEERKSVLIVTEENYLNDIFQRFSCFVRLQRVIAFCIRFRKNSRKESVKRYGPLDVDELQNACHVIIKALQQNHFHEEISLLKNGKPIVNKCFLSLSPFIDQSGILRVGGRLCNADIAFSQKYPVLLPAKDHVVTLLLRREHVVLYHAGPQTVLSNFRLRYWPLNGLRQIKRIVKNCITCYRFKAQTATQIMANLPRDRVNISRPFQNVGLDFGGPFYLKTSILRKAPLTKAYIAIFICMVTKCVHIELVTSLSSEAFLHTLRRFIARRGNPSRIYSDNATNFLGARNQLRELYEFFRRKENLHSIKEFLSGNEIEWKFIPPRSPHWGGIWEAAIKGAKFHILRVVGDTKLTYEEFSTVLASIESILNSRPLTAMSNDPADLSCLTPGHFLIGDSMTAYPEKDLTTVPENRLSIWQKCVKMQQSFWRRWSVEYLNRLQNKPKWISPSKNLVPNQVVLLKEDNIPPLKWSLARVREAISGPDGKVRLVKVRTADGTFTRSITKVCPLPDEDYLNCKGDVSPKTM